MSDYHGGCGLSQAVPPAMHFGVPALCGRLDVHTPQVPFQIHHRACHLVMLCMSLQATRPSASLHVHFAFWVCFAEVLEVLGRWLLVQTRGRASRCQLSFLRFALTSLPPSEPQALQNSLGQGLRAAVRSLGQWQLRGNCESYRQEFWALAANFGLWSLGLGANFGLCKPILGLGTNFGLGLGSQFWALEGDLGFVCRGPGRPHRFK